MLAYNLPNNCTYTTSKVNAYMKRIYINKLLLWHSLAKFILFCQCYRLNQTQNNGTNC